MTDKMREAFELEAERMGLDMARNSYGRADPETGNVERGFYRGYKAALAQQAKSDEPVVTLLVHEEGTSASYALDPLSTLPLGEHSLYLKAQPAIPEGWRCIPGTLTEEMIKAAQIASPFDLKRSVVEAVYYGALNAAPEQTEGEEL